MTIYKVTGRLRSGALWCHYYNNMDAALRGASMAIRAGDFCVTYTIINNKEEVDNVNEHSEPAEQGAVEEA